MLCRMSDRLLLCLVAVLFTSLVAQAQDQLSLSKSERLYNKGKELVEHKNYGAARQILSEYLTLADYGDPRRVDAEYMQALCALRIGNADGEKLIDNFIKGNPSSPKASTAYYDLGMFFYEDKNYTKANSYFAKVEFPALTADQQATGHFAYGYSLFNHKKLDEALEQFNFVKMQKGTYGPAASYYAGFIEYSKGAYEDAIVDLKRAEGNASYAAVVPYLIANIYYRQSKYDELLKYVDGVMDRPNLANKKELSMLLAEAHYFKKDYAQAAAAYETYLETYADKADGALLYRAGYSYYSLSQDDNAIKYLKKSAATSDSIGYYASYYLGILYLKRGEKLYAFNSFEYARKSPSDIKLREEGSFQYAKVAYDAGKPDLAIAELERFLVQYPNSTHDTEVKELLAQAYVNGNNYNKAIEYIEKLPRRNAVMNQAYQKATYLKASELFNKEDYAAAVGHYQHSLDNPIDPGYVALASFWAGEAYSIGGKFEAAIPLYQKAIEVKATNTENIDVKARYGLGYAFFNTKVYDRALINFREYVNLTNRSTPNHVDALVRLGDCYYVTKSYQDALTTYRKANDIGSPDNDYILLQSGIINGILKNYPEARSSLSRLISSYPKSRHRDEALFQRSEFEIEQGNYAVAIEGLSELIRISPESPFVPFAYRRRAECYRNLKRYDKSSADYAHIINQFPRHPVAQQVIVPLQETLVQAGRPGDFDQYLDAVKHANPDGKGFEDVEYEAAKNLYFDQQYTRAITRFNAFIKSYPDSKFLQEARYYTAESHYRQREYDQALSIYTTIENDASLNLGNKVTARIAEIQFRRGSYEEAINSYRTLERTASNKKDLYTAWSGIMESQFLMARYDSVGKYASLIIEKGNVNAGAQNKAALFLGKAALAKGDYTSAQDEFLNALNTAQDEYGAEAKYLLAEIFYNQKQHKQCYETLVSLFGDFAAYELWVGKGYLLLSDNFLALNDRFNAKVTLQSLVDNFPQPSVKDEAARRLQVMKEEEARSQTESDTTGQQ
jgi:TolA-binding protein